MDAGSPITLVLIGSFAVDRIVSGLLFLLAIPERWRRFYPDPELEWPEAKPWAARQRKLNYFLLATLLSVPVVFFGHVRLFPLLGISAPEDTILQGAQKLLDILLTSFIFVGGADRIAELLKTKNGDKPGNEIKVSGSLTVDEQEKKKPAAA